MLAVVGLALAPIAHPAMAMTAFAQAGATSEQAVDHAHMAMPEDMPCCPKKAPIPDCSKDCLAICATQLFCNISAAALAVPVGLANLLLPVNEPGLSSVKQRPPPRPPKI